jgi:Phage Terminase
VVAANAAPSNMDGRHRPTATPSRGARHVPFPARPVGSSIPDPDLSPLSSPHAEESQKVSGNRARSHRRNAKLLGSTEPRLWTRPLRALTPQTSAGFALCEWADENLDIKLLPYQRWLFEHALELNPDGSYRFRTVCLLVARQQGKSTALKVLTLWRMLRDDARLILGTSTNLDTALEAFLGAVELAADSPTIAGEFGKPRLANGQQQLTALNGARYKIAAANRRAARGLSVDLAVLDELREHRDWSAWSAISKTTNARPKGQRWAVSNAGDADSVVLNHLRAAALDGDDSIGLFEWSAPDDCDLDDRAAWAAACPALGYLVSEETIAADLGTDPPAVFRTEVLCQRVTSLDTLFDLDAWDDCADRSGTLESSRSRVCAAVDVAPDLRHVTLAAAASQEDGRTRAEIVAAWDSVPEARAALPALLARVKPRRLALSPGPAVGALGLDLRPLKAAKVLTVAEVAEACAGLVEQVASRRLLHNGDPLASTHVAGATRLPVGDAFRFARRDGHVDAAYALALAVWQARSLPPARQLRIVAAPSD